MDGPEGAAVTVSVTVGAGEGVAVTVTVSTGEGVGVGSASEVGAGVKVQGIPVDTPESSNESAIHHAPQFRGRIDAWTTSGFTS